MTTTERSFPSSASLLWTQTLYQLRSFRRVPVALFFTVGLPIIMLVLFNAIFGGGVVETESGPLGVSQFYTGGLAAFTAVSATYTNLANMVPIRRDEGVLKRWRGTPLPTWILIGGFIVSAVIIAAVSVVAMLTMGVVFYDLRIEAAKVPAAIVTFLVGVASFAALGMAIASLIRTASSASAVANATILPLAFISDVFVVADGVPRWMEFVGNFFPLKPFVNAFQDCFTPSVVAPAFAWDKLGTVALWGVVGLVVAITRFRFEPSGAAPRGRRARSAARAA